MYKIRKGKMVSNRIKALLLSSFLGLVATSNANSATLDVTSITFDEMSLSVTVDGIGSVYSLTGAPVTIDLSTGSTFGISEITPCIGPCDAVTVTTGAFTATADDVVGTFTTSPATLDVLIDFDAGYGPASIDLSLWSFPVTLAYNTFDNTFNIAWGIYNPNQDGYIVDANMFLGGSIETSVIPVPAAAWLFGSGLLGLIGVARRKKA